MEPLLLPAEDEPAPEPELLGNICHSALQNRPRIGA